MTFKNITTAILITCLVHSTLAYGHKKIHRKDYRAQIDLEQSTLNLFGKGNLKYFGGPIISQVKIISVNWGSKVSSQTQTKMPGFYTTLVNSSYIDWLTEYNTPTQQIKRGTFGGSFTITPSKKTLILSDFDIQNEINNQVNLKKLPVPDDNSLYMIHFPGGARITLAEGGSTAVSCQDFCAYHSSAKTKAGKNIYYGVMPDFSSGGCSRGCGLSDTFSNFTTTASHEITEAITDPQIGNVTGFSIAAPAAWYDVNPGEGEIGDICVGTNGIIISSTGIKYSVQGEWSNVQNACVTGPAKSL